MDCQVHSFGRRLLPYGYRFHPTDGELVREYLRRRVHGKSLSFPICPCLVYDVDVYAQEPWLLPWPYNPFLVPNERYFFVKRERISKNSNGKRPRRNLEGQVNGGWWKTNIGEKDILDDQNRLLGHMKSLTFFAYTDNQRDRKQAIKTDWIMHEYSLPSINDTFQEWVLCRIKYKGHFEVNNDAEAMEEIGQHLEEHNAGNALASSSSAIADPSSGLPYMQQDVEQQQHQQFHQISAECSNNVINGAVLLGDVQELGGGNINIEQPQQHSQILWGSCSDNNMNGTVVLEYPEGDEVQELEGGNISIEQQQQQSVVLSESCNNNNNMNGTAVPEYLEGDDVYDHFMEQLLGDEQELEGGNINIEQQQQLGEDY